MRQGIVSLTQKYRDILSNDLGAIAGALFDAGSGRYPLPPRDADEVAIAKWESDLSLVREEADRANMSLQAAREDDRNHSEVQGWLRDLGLALGFGV